MRFPPWRRRASAPVVLRGPGDDPNISDEELLLQREAWFESYLARDNVFSPSASGPYACPCCRHVTLPERGGYDICPVCFWEDDGQDDHDADVVRGGPNGGLSLTQARENYLAFGATERRFLSHVRRPLPGELPGGE